MFGTKIDTGVTSIYLEPILFWFWFFFNCGLLMMTSSNGNILCVTGHLCGEFTGHRWIPLTKASDAELWFFFDLRLNKQLSKHSWGWWFETLSRPLWRHCDVLKQLSCDIWYMSWFILYQLIILGKGTDIMMTSSNGNIFRVTGPLWVDSTGARLNPLTKTSDAELWCFLWSAPEQTAVQAIETLVIWNAITFIMASL